MASSSLCNSQATDDLAKRFTEVIYNVAEPLFSKPISDVRERKHIKPAWVNQECENLRDYILKRLNVFRLNQTEENRKYMVEPRNIYNSKDQSRQHMNKLIIARAKDAKIFLKMLRPKCKNAQSTLSA